MTLLPDGPALPGCVMRPDNTASSGTVPPPASENGGSSGVSAAAGRDRVLLYTRGMDLDPVHGVELALSSLRRAGEGASPGKIMGELFSILESKGPTLLPCDSQGRRLVSVPPMNRRAMLPEDMDPLSLTAYLKNRAARFFSSPARKTGGGS